MGQDETNREGGSSENITQSELLDAIKSIESHIVAQMHVNNWEIGCK